MGSIKSKKGFMLVTVAACISSGLAYAADQTTTTNPSMQSMPGMTQGTPKSSGMMPPPPAMPGVDQNSTQRMGPPPPPPGMQDGMNGLNSDPNMMMTPADDSMGNSMPPPLPGNSDSMQTQPGNSSPAAPASPSQPGYVPQIDTGSVDAQPVPRTATVPTAQPGSVPSTPAAKPSASPSRPMPPKSGAGSSKPAMPSGSAPTGSAPAGVTPPKY